MALGKRSGDNLNTVIASGGRVPISTRQDASCDIEQAAWTITCLTTNDGVLSPQGVKHDRRSSPGLGWKRFAPKA
jgi:hypothetical protein